MSLVLKANETSNNKNKKKDNQMIMGLSSKEVSSDSLDWTQSLLLQSGGMETPKPPQVRQQQQQQQQTPPLQCPRCYSTNTKFCYYNNYNRSQPRHFCKSCRRHWTKGGTLRNVPVGGGRKNKRHKTAATNTNQSGNTNTSPNPNMAIQQPLSLSKQKNFSDILQSTLHQPSPPQLPIQLDYINNIDNNGSSSNSSSSGSGFMGSFCSLPPMAQFSPFAATSSYENDLSSSTFSDQPNLFNYTSPTTEDIILENSKDSGFVLDQRQLLISAAEATAAAAAAPFQFPTSNCIDFGGYWNWDDLCMFGSTDTRMPSNNDLQQGI